MKELIALAVTGTFVAGAVIAHVVFVLNHQRLPAGNGELVNWLLGLQ